MVQTRFFCFWSQAKGNMCKKIYFQLYTVQYIMETFNKSIDKTKEINM